MSPQYITKSNLILVKKGIHRGEYKMHFLKKTYAKKLLTVFLD